jgi:phosphoribosylaminoimidazole-succinocarboxamide synthase
MSIVSDALLYLDHLQKVVMKINCTRLKTDTERGRVELGKARVGDEVGYDRSRLRELLHTQMQRREEDTRSNRTLVPFYTR